MSGRIGTCGDAIVFIDLDGGSGVARQGESEGTSTNCGCSDAGLADDGWRFEGIGRSGDATFTSIDCMASISGVGVASAALGTTAIASAPCSGTTMDGGAASVRIGTCTTGITITAEPDGSGVDVTSAWVVIYTANGPWFVGPASDGALCEGISDCTARTITECTRKRITATCAPRCSDSSCVW